MERRVKALLTATATAVMLGGCGTPVYAKPQGRITIVND